MLFKYKGMTKQGKSAKGSIEASSIEEAKQKLKMKGIFYQDIQESSQITMKNFSQREMPGPLLSSFAKELSSYLNSGMTVLTAIKLIEGQHKKEKKYASFLGSLRTMIEEGKSLYHALGSQSVYALPDFFLQSINVAGQSGKMVSVLINMGTFFSSQAKVKKQVGNAMAYPLFIFLVAIGMTGFLIAFVVPKITGIFKDTGQELPEITQFVLGVSDFLSANYITLIVGFILIIIAFKSAYKYLYSFKKAYDGFMLKMPIVGELIQNHELGRFSYILALMLDSGVSYAHAVKLATTTFSNAAFKESFEQASERVIEGNKLSHSLQRGKGVLPKRNFMQALALGEESSEVSNILGNISTLYQEENDDKLKLLLSLLEPVMMLFIGLVVGVIVAAMLLPIFSMNLGAQ
ncbi:type II secretion system F family protein [bacterium]|nr:type II secretion system F family protein [bacterium]MBU1958396.1 type II secretion system F family protein [bacterium]